MFSFAGQNVSPSHQHYVEGWGNVNMQNKKKQFNL
jgi:hypothetical protein